MIGYLPAQRKIYPLWKKVNKYDDHVLSCNFTIALYQKIIEDSSLIGLHSELIEKHISYNMAQPLHVSIKA